MKERAKWNVVVWDQYWIKNNPSDKAMRDELDRMIIVRNNQLDLNTWKSNPSMIIRNERIKIIENILK